MKALSGALRDEGCFPAGIAWVTHAPQCLLPRVTEFLEAAHLAGSDVCIVDCPNFDQFATDLADVTRLPAPFVKHIFADRPPAALVSVPLPSHAALKSPVLRYSALPLISIPVEARRITLSKASTTPLVRDLLKAAGVWATVACNGREVAAFGKDADLLRALQPLGAAASGTTELRPDVDSWALGTR